MKWLLPSVINDFNCTFNEGKFIFEYVCVGVEKCIDDER